MSFEELLKSLGYTDEQIKSITEGMKTNKIHLSKEENADIRLPKLQQDLDAKGVELDKANKLIETLQESAKNNDVEGMKTKITEYETTIAKLQDKIKAENIKNQLTIALKDAGVTDVDYIAFKIKEKMKEDKKDFELDDNEKIKGLSEMIENEKKLSPNFFKSESKKEVQVKELGNPKEDSSDGEPKDLKSALVQAYNEKTNNDI